MVRQYDVRYAYVDPVERERYGNVSFTDVNGVAAAFENDRVTVCRVDTDRLPAGDGQPSPPDCEYDPEPTE